MKAEELIINRLENCKQNNNLKQKKLWNQF